MKCELCGADAGEYGNNGQPLVDGKVDDWCNMNLVIPLRMRLISLREEAPQPEG